MINRDILRIFSPLLLFVAHLIYLTTFSNDYFLNKWIDGSFTFFVALVLCNVIRSHIIAQTGKDRSPDPSGRDTDDQESDNTL